MLTLRTLGRPRLDGPQGELLSGRRKELAVLAYLGRRHGSLPREELAELFWGSRPDANARQSLRQALLQLKRALPSGLEAEGDAVMLRRDALQLDANLFEADLAAGRLAEAVDRWQGDFLAGQDDAGGPAYGAWLDGQRQALRTRLRVAFGQLVERADRDGDADAALHWAERWAEWFPHDERAATRVIRGLYHAGRTGEALGRHAVFDSRLRQDLGIEASPDFARLAAELQGAAPAAPPAPASGALFTPELVGRRPALAALEGAWAAATAGTTTLVLVEGEDGIGKTRLIEEFIRGITSKVVLLRGRGSETSGRVPHAVLGELLTGLADAPGLSGARPSTLAALGAVVPAIRECFPPPADAAVAAWDDAVVDVLAAVATAAAAVGRWRSQSL